MCNKLGAYDLYAPARGRVLKVLSVLFHIVQIRTSRPP